MAAEGWAHMQPGDVLAGKYRVERVLGKGAMGVVVAAMHLDLQEMRAIKLMLPNALGAAGHEERFLREARAASRLKNPHVTKVHDIGRFENGTPYIVMEFLEGVDLKGHLASCGPLPIMDAVTYVLQACEALAEAHAAGIVHRDLKPENMYLTQAANGAPFIKVLDFGIAKMTGPTAAVDVTKTSELFGTPLYMSPEQMRSSRTVDARTDVWALGAMLYQMLTGRTPFTGTTITEVCSAVIADEPEPPTLLRADIPPDLEAIILRCLRKKAADRFADAGQLLALLTMFVRETETAAQANPAQPVRRTGRGTLLIRQQPKVPAPEASAASHISLQGLAPTAVPGPPAASQAGAAAQPPIRPPLPSYPMAMPRPPMPSQPWPPVASYPAAVPRPPMPSNVSGAEAVGQTTTRGASWTQPAKAEVQRSRTPLWVFGGLVVAALAGSGVLVYSWKAPSAPSSAQSVAPEKTVSDVPAATPSSTGSAAAEPTMEQANTEGSDPEATVAPHTSAVATSALAPSASPRQATSASSKLAPTAEAERTDATRGGDRDFDGTRALAALGAAAGAAKSCKTHDGPTGSGKVKVTFAPSGNVTSAVVQGAPFAGTSVGTCVANTFRGVRVAPFAGSEVSVTKSFTIN